MKVCGHSAKCGYCMIKCHPVIVTPMFLEDCENSIFVLENITYDFLPAKIGSYKIRRTTVRSVFSDEYNFACNFLSLKWSVSKSKKVK